MLREIICAILGHRVTRTYNGATKFFKQFPKFYCYRCGEYVDYFKSRSLLLFFSTGFSYIKRILSKEIKENVQ